ncbi:hypothetical protein LMG28140_03301 [Paraburkholderia metrosideri]|uniref:Transposon Tn7 transposition protein TnsD C-terminal domain-containing protein n=2 Tax=Paraburkholderia metrosideri TaxID=580937 RepID=A0ABN7HX21_9BURK|nr:hypothetical protein LMG28140_03301 [Paraburkholderia metrosideri]
MPSRLYDFYARIGYLLCARDELETKHTLLAYELLGVPLGRQEIIKDRLRRRCTGPIRSSRLPVLLTPSEGTFFVCPECEEEAFIRYGFSFTHRRNVAPFVAACPYHFCWLRSSAQAQLLFENQCQRRPSKRQLPDAIQFAFHSVACVEGDQTSSAYSKAGVIAALRNARWLTLGNRFQLAELLDAFHSFFRDRFDDCRLDELVSTSEYVERALRALMREDRAVHPVWCILLTWFAQNCESKRLYAPVSTHREVKRITDEDVRSAMALHATVGLAANALNVTPHQLTIFCRCAGIPVDARPSKLSDSRLTTIRQYLSDGIHPEQIARATQLSTTSIYRVLAAMPDVESHYRRRVSHSTDEAKQRWLMRIKEHPEATRTQLRYSALATFAALHRNAPEWLKRHTPAPAPAHSRVRAHRSATAISALARAADAAETYLDSLEGPPRRRSAYRLRELLGITEYAMKSSLTHSAPRAASQSRDAYIAARVDWVARRAPHVNLENWRTARAAVLRLTTLRKWKLRREGVAQTRVDERNSSIPRNKHSG